MSVVQDSARFDSVLPERQCWFFRQQIELMYSRCDLDGDGRLDYEEFKRLILRQRYPDR